MCVWHAKRRWLTELAQHGNDGSRLVVRLLLPLRAGAGVPCRLGHHEHARCLLVDGAHLLYGPVTSFHLYINMDMQTLLSRYMYGVSYREGYVYHAHIPPCEVRTVYV